MMIPVLMIAVAAIIGLLMSGFEGLVAGAVVGFVLTVVVGGLVNKLQGGAVPRAARRRVVVNTLLNYPEVASKAFPGQSGEDLFTRVEALVNDIGKRAAKIAPSPSSVWSGPVVLEALTSLTREAPTASLRSLYSCLTIQIGRDWYSQSSEVRSENAVDVPVAPQTISILGGNPDITIPFVSFAGESDPERRRRLYLTALSGASHLLVNRLHPIIGSRLPIESLRGISLSCAEAGFHEGLATGKTTEGLYVGAELAFEKYRASFETPEAAIADIVLRFPPNPT